MSESAQSGAGRREVAYRLFATEFEDADLSYSESDEERAPNYVITPTGARVNRLFVVGVLTEVEQVSEDVLRGRVVDPTGAFVLYAGQYQPDEMAFLEAADPPTFVAVTGKARTFQPEDSDRVFTSIRPETINEVDAETRDRWTVQAAEHTLDRIAQTATALSLDERGDGLRAALTERGVDEGLAAGIPVALDHYGTTPAYLAAVRDVTLDAARVVAGTTDEVPDLDVRPDEPGDAQLDVLQDSGVPGPHARGDDAGDASASHPAGTEPDPTVTSDDEPAAVQSSEPDESPNVAETAVADAGDEELGDFEPGEYELEEETREQIEEEYGTEFQTGTEVDEPGEADVDLDVDAPEADAGATDTEPATGSAPESIEGADADGSAGEDDGTVEAESTETEDGETAEEPEDLQAAVVDLMGKLDDGTGADREELLDTATERFGVEEAAVEDAIQGALMDGQCYEPDDATLQPI